MYRTYYNDNDNVSLNMKNKVNLPLLFIVNLGVSQRNSKMATNMETHWGDLFKGQTGLLAGCYL